jgi:CheY-like chemotaxis protein
MQLDGPLRRPNLTRNLARGKERKPMLQKIRILLVDDHKDVRQGLADLLCGESDIEIIAQASDGHTAIELSQQLQLHLM